MAVKRTMGRAGIDPAVELKAWRMTFKSGHDYLRALRAIGVPDGERHRPPPKLMRDAWRRLGAAYLSGRDMGDPPCWAETEMGRPPAPGGREYVARKP
jgi:hypothetical protein